MPELELGQPSDERPELLILLRRERTPLPIVSVFEPLVLRKRWVELRLQEGEEEVQEVDTQTVGNNVPALCENDAQGEEDEEGDCERPAVGDVRGEGVEVGLIFLG